MKKRLEMDRQRIGDVDVVAVSGTFDDASIDRFKRLVQGLYESPSPRILLDFHGLDFVNSVCIGLLAGFENECAARGGRLALCNLSQDLLRIVEMIHLDQLLKIFKTREEAIDYLASQE